ncbi:hypothetical protein [Mucilaginibacter paludis]|uniref:Uncharacterized protein n=1 Tax=Mucilaginibacter paludis DSM 18603 TaxID=714943 RepID=H1XZM9_9SPHI|nr:hypothetical protein [Mucilaginibacter paludis]EHQ26673.1 hypothetical protein Mucpa_2558 [Mucilaginibacter paludis DSM 18603]
MAGKVIDGYVKQGMTLKSEDGDHNQEISSVEYVDSSLEKGLVGLAFKITSKEQLDALQRFKPNDIVKIE